MLNRKIVHFENEEQCKKFNDFVEENGLLISNGTELELSVSEERQFKMALPFQKNTLKERLVKCSVIFKSLWGEDLEAVQIPNGQLYLNIEKLIYYCKNEVIEGIDYHREINEVLKMNVIKIYVMTNEKLSFIEQSKRKFEI